MKIAMPVDDKIIKTNISQSFGRAPYLLIYDTESKESLFLDNSAAASQGGAGIKAAQTIVDNKVTALLTPRCGENAAEVINKANIQMFKVINDSVEDNVKALKDGKLALLVDIHAGFHNHGGK
ncbi:dinitrogenase iron-molybdenum cofactor biosynthesis protein [Desulfosporosinus fructosivorans]|uniref:Dinitrogenase iron-molybdenum cofactor biosynthesis protein n=1 Tax=Desulfosporosinus fructosivorans TaxID=2018669 RepID=A0A4Z0R4Z9_9FIRM|nr:NifB/NifX family molybdenum-iron cluster-binding protein [Desulfosporosinus fructosivorans]TGE38122.1 dinitrogenase iron-molybdenum cofactor biosynthesis protein [Desulfosporosinus fructosivorans]